MHSTLAFLSIDITLFLMWCCAVQEANTTTTEEEGCMEGAVADDADAEYVRAVCERDIVGPDTALARYLPLLRHLLTAGPSDAPQLHAAAALALARYNELLFPTPLIPAC